MRVITNKKCVLCRRAKKKLYLKGEKCYLEKCPLSKRNYPPGVHGDKANRRTTEFGRQLQEKQKLRNTYGLGESQFSNYVVSAKNKKGAVLDNLYSKLESRLDNVVYRLGWASSRSEARQRVNHGMVKVNDRKVDIPSYSIRKGDLIELKPKVYEKVGLEQITVKNLKDRNVPKWLSSPKKKGEAKAKILDLPKKAEANKDIDMVLAIEYYTAK